MTVAPAAAIATAARALRASPLSFLRVHDTIAAIATPPGRGAIGIVRLSGPDSPRIAAALISLKQPLQPRRPATGELSDAEGRLVDSVLVTWFAAPRSYTAEDVVEISCHGAPVLLRHALARALELGARLAEPGEFTLRAFVNGRLDLPQAEAVRDLIDATTLYQARVAARQAQGSVSARLAPLKANLLELIALLEAGIDFAEDDISVAPAAELLRRLDPCIALASALARSFAWGRIVRSGFSLALVGLPNAGKSSLFNRLLEQDRAIVTPIPGTTRDTVSESTDFAGVPVRLVDTAGIRDSAEPIEQLGIARSREAMSDADLTLLVRDAAAPPSPDLETLLAEVRTQGKYVVAANKADLPGFAALPGEFPVSAATGEGIAALRDAILDALTPGGHLQQEGEFITSLRQSHLLEECLAMLEKARQSVLAGLPHELLLLDLYCALRPLDQLTGKTTADDILNGIFSTFCIGK